VTPSEIQDLSILLKYIAGLVTFGQEQAQQIDPAPDPIVLEESQNP
jgi:hypothetical protein